MVIIEVVVDTGQLFPTPINYDIIHLQIRRNPIGKSEKS